MPISISPEATGSNSPAAVTVILSQPLSQDAMQILLRDSFESVRERAQRFAVKMFDGGGGRDGLPLTVEIIGQDGVPFFNATRK